MSLKLVFGHSSRRIQVKTEAAGKENEMDETYVVAAILLAHALGTSGREAQPAEIQCAVLNAEKLREELRKRGEQRQKDAPLGVIEHLKQEAKAKGQS